MTNTNIVRVTKAQKYEAIKSIMEQVADSFDPIVFKAPLDKDGNKTKEDAVLDAQAIMDFCDEQIEQLNRKTSSDGEKKQTERQKENEDLKALIVEYLTAQEKAQTCTEIGKAIPELNGLNNQRISRLMNALFDKGNGPVKKETVKGTSYFSIA